MLHGFARLDGFFLNGIDLIPPLIPGLISFSLLPPFLAYSPSRFSYVVICSNFLGFIDRPTDRPINRLMPSSCRWEAVKEGVDEMIKLLANEPSVGLFFVEQHAQTSMPYLLGLKDKVGEKIHEVTLHTEDIEDSICSVRSMTEYGIPIVEEMIKDLNKSLLIMSGSQPKRRSVRSPSWGVHIISNLSTQDSFSCSIGSDHQHGGSSHSCRKQKAKCPNRASEAAEGDELTSPDLLDAQVDDKTVTVAGKSVRS